MLSSSVDELSPMRVSRVLLCDDSPVERMAVAHLLRQQGYEVDEAGDGESALHYLKHRSIDLLLLDLNLPEINGFEILSYLQVHRPGLPVIILSGMPVDEIQGEIHRLPNHEIPTLLLKPVNPEQLLQIVELELSGEMP